MLCVGCQDKSQLKSGPGKIYEAILVRYAVSTLIQARVITGCAVFLRRYCHEIANEDAYWPANTVVPPRSC